VETKRSFVRVYESVSIISSLCEHTAFDCHSSVLAGATTRVYCTLRQFVGLNIYGTLNDFIALLLKHV